MSERFIFFTSYWLELPPTKNVSKLSSCCGYNSFSDFKSHKIEAARFKNEKSSNHFIINFNKCYLSIGFVIGEFILEDPKNYPFLSSGLLPVPGVDDAGEFQQTCNAMTIMGMSPEDFSGKF